MRHAVPNEGRTIITGMGAVSAAGSSLVEHFRTFEAAQRNIGLVTLFSTQLDYVVFEARSVPQASASNEMRTLRLASMALNEALAEAGLTDNREDCTIGICLGTTVACQLNDLEFYRTYRETGLAPMNAVDRFLKGNLADALARKYGFEGPRTTVVNACSSGTDAIGIGLSWLGNGLCDVVVVGGADELNLVPLCGFGSLGVASRHPCAPFDRDRQGLNLGEGAGVLVLETESFARKRGNNSLLFLSGYATAGDAYHLTAPRPDGSGLEKALRLSLLNSGISPNEICFVNAHGTATLDNDKVEGAVLAKVFGENVKFLSTKGFTGHTLGAAGGLEAVFTAAALRAGWIPSSIGFANRDEEIPISPVTERTAILGSFAVSTSLAFGGTNSALVLEHARTRGQG